MLRTGLDTIKPDTHNGRAVRKIISNFLNEIDKEYSVNSEY